MKYKTQKLKSTYTLNAQNIIHNDSQLAKQLAKYIDDTTAWLLRKYEQKKQIEKVETNLKDFLDMLDGK